MVQTRGEAVVEVVGEAPRAQLGVAGPRTCTLDVAVAASQRSTIIQRAVSQEVRTMSTESLLRTLQINDCQRATITRSRRSPESTFQGAPLRAACTARLFTRCLHALCAPARLARAGWAYLVLRLERLLARLRRRVRVLHPCSVADSVSGARSPRARMQAWHCVRGEGARLVGGKGSQEDVDIHTTRTRAMHG